MKQRDFLNKKSSIQKGSDVIASKMNPLQKKKALQKKVSPKQVLKLCEEKLSLEKIASQLGISKLSVATLIERAIRKGGNININFYVPSHIQNEIEEAFFILQTSNIKRISEHLKERATIEEIRIVRGYLQYKQRPKNDEEYF